jgi:bacillithiol biosynthesis deacetylase BshB1
MSTDHPSASKDAASVVDLVVFAAHPDDAELSTGGLLLVAASRGWRTGIVDLTRGELGTLGTPEIRAREAEAAARVLGLSVRRNLGLPDGRLHDCDEFRLEIVRAVRELRPRLVIAPPRQDHHPDHMAAAELVRQSFYLTGIAKYCPELPPWRPRGLFHYAGGNAIAPTLVVDVSAVIEKRREAIRCYASQFQSLPAGAPPRIAAPFFLDSVDGHLRHFGSRIGVPFGEGYVSDTPLPVADPVGLFTRQPWQAAAEVEP